MITMPRFHPLYVKHKGKVGWYITDSKRPHGEPIVPVSDKSYASREEAADAADKLNAKEA